MKSSFVYILTNQYRTPFYIGATSDLQKRITDHQNDVGSVFTKKYNLKDLIYFEEFNDITQAITREKQLNNWKKRMEIESHWNDKSEA